MRPPLGMLPVAVVVDEFACIAPCLLAPKAQPPGRRLVPLVAAARYETSTGLALAGRADAVAVRCIATLVVAEAAPAAVLGIAG